MKSPSSVRLRNGEKEYLDNLLSMFDDLPNGAWGVACQNHIEADSRFKGRDAYEVWLAWCWENRDRSQEGIK